MTETELLTWLRGPALQYSVVIFVLGLVFRVAQNLLIGTKPNLAEPRPGYSAMQSGLGVIYRRSLFHPGMTISGYFTLVAGYTFHLGFLLTLFFLEQHIMLFRSIIGFGWPAFPPIVIDLLAVLSIAALIAVLIHRLTDPVLKLLSDYQDYLAWALTILPLITGFMVMHGIGLPYKTALAAHLITVILLIIAIPFTKLSHMVSLFISRWYNGAIAGYKGVEQ